MSDFSHLADCHKRQSVVGKYDAQAWGSLPATCYAGCTVGANGQSCGCNWIES